MNKEITKSGNYSSPKIELLDIKVDDVMQTSPPAIELPDDEW